MAARADSTSSEEFLSDVTSENECNFYNSDLGETSVASMDVGPRPYRFEPRRIRRNVEGQRINNHEEQTESETNRLGNTDWKGKAKTGLHGLPMWFLWLRCIIRAFKL